MVASQGGPSDQGGPETRQSGTPAGPSVRYGDGAYRSAPSAYRTAGVPVWPTTVNCSSVVSGRTNLLLFESSSFRLGGLLTNLGQRRVSILCIR